MVVKRLPQVCKPTKPGSFAWTSPYDGFWTARLYREAGGLSLYGDRKVKNEEDLRGRLVAGPHMPELMMMGNFIVERHGIVSICRELGIDTVHGEDGFFPHYESCHADPLGFCWESSLTRMQFRALSGPARERAGAARGGWLEREYPPLPPAVKKPFVLWPIQLLGDKVNEFGMKAPEWRPMLEHLRAMLPQAYQLVIKDHPRGSDFAAMRKWVGTLPNTLLLPKQAPLATLLRDCNGVAGANSTVLLEARLMFHKPVWAYARSWYSGHEQLVLPLSMNFGPRRSLPRPDWLEDNQLMRGEYLDDYADWFLDQLLQRQCSHHQARQRPIEFRQWVERRSFRAWQQGGEEIFGSDVNGPRRTYGLPRRNTFRDQECVGVESDARAGS